MTYQVFSPALLTLSPLLTTVGNPSASVAGVNTTTVADGALVYCAENKQTYRLDKQDETTPADGTTVIGPLAGPGRWKILASAGGSQPDYSVTAVVASGAPPATVQAIPLDDDATTRVVINASARDAAGNWYAIESYTRWTRTAGGGATQLGTDAAPPDANNIPDLVGLSLAPNGNDLNVVYEGSSSTDTRYDIRVWLLTIPLASP